MYQVNRSMKRRQAPHTNGKHDDDEEKAMLHARRQRSPFRFPTVNYQVWKKRAYALVIALFGMVAIHGKLRRMRTISQRQDVLKAAGAANQQPHLSTLSRLPREPKLTPGCSVKFDNANMSLCYFLPYGANFGDELGPAAVKRILEYHFQCSADDVHVIDMASADPGLKRENRVCLFALGSIFHYTRTGDHVWGTGINPTHQGPRHPDWLHIHAVRGPETEQKMKEWYNVTSVPHVDPGFLIPTLYQDYYHLPTKSIGKEPAFTLPKFCFIPHAHDLELPQIQKHPPDLQIISVKQHWTPMIEAIRMCDYVISTSLHGIIVADALGIPTKWFQFQSSMTQKTEGSFKYHDYLWSIGRTNVQEPSNEFSMPAFKRVSTYMGPIPIDARKEIVAKYLSSFPFHIFRKSLVPLNMTKVLSDCDVTFKDENMVLCVLSKSSGFVADIGVAVVKRLVENRFGCSAKNLPVVAASMRDRNQKCLLIEGGGILDYAARSDHVWGAGAQSNKLRKLPIELSVWSVRGPDTAAAARKRISSLASLQYGDPAFLFAYLHREKLNGKRSTRRSGSSARFCYIANERDDEEEVAKELPSGVSLISTDLPLERAMESLQNCDFVAASSLNGLILSDSLGIPTKWMQTEKETNVAFELVDFFKSTERKAGEAILDYNDIPKERGYKETLALDARERFADKTAASFPFDLFETTQNRTLVIIMGRIRGGERAWESLYKNVLDLNSADLALVVGEVAPKNRTSSLYARAKYLYEFPEFTDWADAVDLFNGSRWRDELLANSSKEDGLFGAADGHTGSGAVIFMARWYVSKAIVKFGLKERYDRFVLTRSDHYYGCAHDLSRLDPAFVWVPEGQAYGGVTDRHLVCNSGQIMKAIDIYPNPIHYPMKYVDEAWYKRNPEQMIARRWKEENLWDDVRYFNRVMFTCADAGDTTRWQVPSQDRAPEGVFLKYVIEYNQTKCRCGGMTWDETENSCRSSRKWVMNDRDPATT